MKQLQDDITYFWKQKFFMVMLCITAVGCYGYAITHEAIGIDDTMVEVYLQDGLEVLHGRWVLYLLNKVFYMAEFMPYITDFAQMLLLIVAAVMFCVLLKRLLGRRIEGNLAYIAFACTFVSCPFISELNFYYDHEGTELGYILCAFSLILFLDSLDKRGKNGMMSMLGSMLFLWVAVGCYESFVIMYIVGVLLILFFRGITDQEKVTFRLLIQKLFAVVCIVAGCIVLRTLMYNIVKLLFSLQETSSGEGYRALGYRFRLLFESGEWLSEASMLLKRYWLVYCVNGVVYFPITVYMVSAIVFGAASVVYAVKKKNCWYPVLFLGMLLVPVILTFLEMSVPLYRTCQYMPFFVASAVIMLYLTLVNMRWKKAGITVFAVLSAALVWNQAFETNRNYYVDYLKYEHDKSVLIEIAQKVTWEYGTGATVIFTGSYDPPYELVKHYYALYSSPGFKRVQTIANLSGDPHLIEKYYSPYGYYFGGEAQFSVIDWGLWAYDRPGVELVHFLQMHGFQLQTTEDETVLQQAQAFAESMPEWPEKGSIAEMEGYVIVNFSGKGDERTMNRFEYIIESIDGDYANLRRTDAEALETGADQELKLVARALLPPEITEGTKLLYEWMQYSIME